MAEILVLCGVLFGAGMFLGVGVGVMRLRQAAEGARALEDELRGWVLCERALHEELP